MEDKVTTDIECLSRPAVVAFDPGRKNFAAWRGYLNSTEGNAHGCPLETERLCLFDLGRERPAYERVCDVLAQESWLTEGNPRIVIETQAPTNTPARIIANTIYGFYRGRGHQVAFSGSAAKARAVLEMCRELGIEEPELHNRKEMTIKQRYKDNKKQSVRVVRELVRQKQKGSSSGALSVFTEASRKRKKCDDLADALLLGYAELTQSRHAKNKQKKQRKSKNE